MCVCVDGWAERGGVGEGGACVQAYSFDMRSAHNITTHCSSLQHTATHCNTLQHTATHGDTLQHTATHSSIWLRISKTKSSSVSCDVTDCNKWQVHQALACCSVLLCVAVCCGVLQCVAVCCSVLQCVAACCSVLQCVAVRCSAEQWKRCRVLQYVALLLHLFGYGVASMSRLLKIKGSFCKRAL